MSHLSEAFRKMVQPDWYLRLQPEEGEALRGEIKKLRAEVAWLDHVLLCEECWVEGYALCEEGKRLKGLLEAAEAAVGEDAKLP